MQQNLASSTDRSLSLGASHGYRLEGDRAFLNAELIAAQDGLQTESWALQLWACDAPYEGGPLRGLKVAEAALPSEAARLDRLEAAAVAQLPPVQRDYAMVLVLASGRRGAYDQVHDFSNYPARQGFTGPHLAGSVGYRFEGDQVILQAEHVRNARTPENLSGTLALELWALSTPYVGAEPEGTRLAQAELGRLGGQSAQQAIERRVVRADLRAGVHTLALLLREWTESGYQTRDFCNFAQPYQCNVEPQQVEPVQVAQTRVVGEEVAPTRQAELAVTREPERAPTREPEPSAKAPLKSALVRLPETRARLSLASATVDELAKVKGLNLKLAQTIVRARPFASLDDLLRVRGIGDKLLQKLRAELTL